MFVDPRSSKRAAQPAMSPAMRRPDGGCPIETSIRMDEALP
jgi:hypothetical protein